VAVDYSLHAILDNLTPETPGVLDEVGKLIDFGVPSSIDRKIIMITPTMAVAPPTYIPNLDVFSPLTNEDIATETKLIMI